MAENKRGKHTHKRNHADSKRRRTSSDDMESVDMSPRIGMPYYDVYEAIDNTVEDLVEAYLAELDRLALSHS